MKRYLTLLVALALLAPVVALAPATAQTTGGEVFVATLSGDAEVPSVDTDGTGIALFTVSDDGTSMDYVLVVNEVSGVTQAHIHIGPADDNGPVAAFLLDFNEAGIDHSGQIATGTLTDAEVVGMTLADMGGEMADGNAYVNVHNVTYPGGVVRGQIAQLDVVDAFTDDDGNAHEDNINVIAAAGITQGTSPTTYSPDGVVLRRQMAAFLTRAFNLPMTGTTDHFTDDDGTIFEPYINAVADAGVSLGCAAGLFCPDDFVTRAQMASFIVRAIGFQVAPNGDFFDDVPDNVHTANINALAGMGITLGTSADNYSPNDAVGRDQMASFLSRTHRAAERSPQVFALTILHNNDGESELVADGDVGGAARFKAVVDQQKALGHAQSDGVLMLSSGDNFLAGTAFEASLQDGIFYDVLTLEAIGYDSVQLGNHDFDFGPDVLADFINAYVEPPQYLAANLDFSGEANLQALVDDGTIAKSTSVEVNGWTVGIVGAVTPNLPFISSPRDVVVDSDVAGAVQPELDALAGGGADILIMISHLQGVDEDLALAPDLSGVDVVIAGGGDELLANSADELLPDDDVADIFGAYPLTATNAEGADVPVVTTSGQYGYLGRLVVYFDTDGNVVDSSGGPIAINGQAQNADLLTTVETPVADFQAGLAANVIGTSQVELDGVRDNVRSIETNEGNLIADALLWQATDLAGDFGANPPDVAIQNGGGIRNDDIRAAGATVGTPADVTELDTFDMLPFGNILTIVEDIPRSQFKEILENAVSALNSDGSLGSEGTGRFAQIAGARFVWDGNGTPQVLDDDENVTTPGTRITDVWLLNPDGTDGEQIITAGVVQAGADLNIAIANFLATGGDQYPFRGAPFTNLGVSDQQTLSAYIQAAAADGGLEGLITAADYPEGGEGRITGP